MSELRDVLPARSTDPDAIAAAVRSACIAAAVEAYEDAGLRGLCAEGRWELAVSAMRQLDLAPFLGRATG